MGQVFYVGGYGQPGQAGLLKCAFDGGRATVLAACDALRNPSWVLANPGKGLVYAVEELSPAGRLATLADGAEGLRVVSSLSTDGADPCHIALTPDGRHLLVANYTGGSLAVYGLDARGMPTGMTDFIQHEMDDAQRAKGNPTRQEGPHIHFSLCDGRHVYVCDLGLNRVFVYGWDGANGRLVDEGVSIEFPDGAGPRHLAFAPDGETLYVLCELSATLHVFKRGTEGRWQAAQVESTVPEPFGDFERFAWSAGAAIHFAPDGTLCASTRGHDSVAAFQVGADGRLSGRQVLPSGGKTPRDFLPVAEGLLVANQDSDGVSFLRREGDGYRAAAPCLDAVRPTCLCGA